MKEKLQMYIGSFSHTFFSLKFNPETVEIEDLHAISDPAGRSAYFDQDEEGKYLYIANEYGGGDGGLQAFKLVEGQDPVFLNAIYSGTQGPAQNWVTKAYGRTFVLGAGYYDGDVMVCPTAEDGSLLPMTDHFKLADIGKFAERGTAHGISVVPNSNLAVVPDTLNGQIYTFELTPEGKLVNKFIFNDPAVRHPRHSTYSADGNQLYMLTERANSLEVFDINKETGELTHVYHESTLPEDYTGNNMCAGIHRSPDGRFVYLTNRGHNSIVCFRVDGEKIEKVGYAEDGIEWPREFLITPDGEYMLVGNQKIQTVTIHKMNRETGMPEYTGKSYSLPEGPTCFFSIPRPADS